MKEKNQATSIVPIKAVMSVVLIGISVLAYTVYGERMPNESDPGVIPIILLVLAVSQFFIGLRMCAKARSGEPTAVIAVASFEVITLLAFLYVSFIDTTAQLWIVPLAAVISLALIWLASPNTQVNSEDQESLSSPKT